MQAARFVPGVHTHGLKAAAQPKGRQAAEGPEEGEELLRGDRMLVAADGEVGEVGGVAFLSARKGGT